MTREEAIEFFKIEQGTAKDILEDDEDAHCVRILLEAISMAIATLEANRWIPVSEGLPEIGQKVSIRSICDSYDAVYDPENPHLPWHLFDSMTGKLSPLYRRAECVDEWMPLLQPPTEAVD